MINQKQPAPPVREGKHMTELTNESERLYMRVYNYYRELIVSGQMRGGARLPSIRQCAAGLQISRTTAEAAYLQLAADGYVIARPQSGYYVTERPAADRQRAAGIYGSAEEQPKQGAAAVRYDFSSRSVDRTGFDFDIWRRYIKSALRQDERLLSYGEPQGERELREALAKYLAAERNVACRPEQIVIGAGTQSLLQILCPLLSELKKIVSFPAASMVQGITVFQNYGYEIHIKDKNAPVVYVSPSHMNRLGDVMPVSRRLDLIRHAAGLGNIIIEDDYESELQEQPTPALFGLAGGEGVVYLGTCSRLLLPSIRIGYMVLPNSLLPYYEQQGGRYNQTASKTEQIALCQLIRDGHMEARQKKLRRLYVGKTKQLYRELKQVFGEYADVREHSLCVTVAVPAKIEEACVKRAEEAGIRFDSIQHGEKEISTLVLSSLTMPAAKVEEGAAALGECLLPFLKGTCEWRQ